MSEYYISTRLSSKACHPTCFTHYLLWISGE
nr:MAG TPA: hypothetical protein [Caudoviricetes sp.]DAR50917.1 MAG TPA: hypothetical protein [Caudoviricetes sp.]